MSLTPRELYELQVRIEEHLSRIENGNSYVLKIRDNRQVVKAMYILAPDRVTPLVAPNGDVFYEIRRDDLSRLPADLPAIVRP